MTRKVPRLFSQHLLAFFSIVSSVFVIAACLLFVIFNVSYDPFLSPTPEQSAREAVLLHPWDASAHARLSMLYNGENDQISQREALLSSSYVSSQPVLGITSPSSYISNDLLQHWVRVTSVIPEYRYGKERLALLFWDAGMVEESRILLSTLLREYPTDGTIKSLSRIIQ